SRQRLVRWRGGEGLSRAIERHLLIERGAYALREAAVNLSVHDHGIHQLAAVLDDDVAQDFHVSDFRIDRHQGGMRGIAEGSAVARRFVTDRGLEDAGIYITREILRATVPGARDLRLAGQPLRDATLVLPV